MNAINGDDEEMMEEGGLTDGKLVQHQIFVFFLLF